MIASLHPKVSEMKARWQLLPLILKAGREWIKGVGQIFFDATVWIDISGDSDGLSIDIFLHF